MRELYDISSRWCSREGLGPIAIERKWSATVFDAKSFVALPRKELTHLDSNVGPRRQRHAIIRLKTGLRRVAPIPGIAKDDQNPVDEIDDPVFRNTSLGVE